VSSSAASRPLEAATIHEDSSLADVAKSHHFHAVSDEPPCIPSRPIGAVDAAILLGLIVVGTQLGIRAMVFLVSVATSAPTSLAREVVATRPIFAGIAQTIVGALVLAGARRFYLPGRRFSDAYGVRAISMRSVVLAAVVGATMQIPLAEIGNLVEELVPIPLDEKLRLASLLAPTSFFDGLGLVLAVVALAPVTEELLFRGLLLPGIARGSGIVVAAVVSTLAFAIAHVRPGAVAVAFAGGAVLALTTVKRRGIVPSIVIHAANNAIPILLPARLVAIPGMNVATDGASHVNPLLLVASLGAFALAFKMLLREAHAEPT